MVQLGVNIAIIDDEGRVLLTQREDFEVWCLPGGAVDKGESIAEAALREGREETGIAAELTRLVGVYSAPLWEGPHIVLFAARPVGGTLRAQASEVLDLGFFAPDELPEHMLLGQRQRILDALSGVVGLARTRATRWPFDAPMTRQELYALRDASGLSRLDFYLQHVVAGNTEAETLDIPHSYPLH